MRIMTIKMEKGRAVMAVSYTNTLTLGRRLPAFRIDETMRSTPDTTPETSARLGNNINIMC